MPMNLKMLGSKREGVVGLTENLAALKRWMVAGPEFMIITNTNRNIASRVHLLKV